VIDVISFEKGVKLDTAEDVEDPETALVAARAFLSDFLSDTRKRRSQFSVGFYVDGALVRLLTAPDLCPVAIPATA
jgi:hypothetical protein